MAFLDNSGDIILDAVLTDTGRKRLAKGDGSFKIDKFALGDDEIDYSLYNPSHESGNSHYDLNILMTPILEAFTNNASSMKSKLLSIVRDDLLYLPVLKANGQDNFTTYGETASHFIAVDTATVKQFKRTDSNNLLNGTLNGNAPTANATANMIRVEQGIDNSELFGQLIDIGLKETQYIIEMDNRLGVLCGTDGSEKTVSYIDDDNIASYYVSTSDGNVVKIDSQYTADELTEGAPEGWVLFGPRGTRLEFKVRASVSLTSSTTLFDKLGSVTTETLEQVSSSHYKFIDTNIRITGATTGASIDMPVRYVKKTS